MIIQLMYAQLFRKSLPLFLGAAIVLLLPPATCIAAEPAGAVRATRPPAVDGKLNDPAWTEAKEYCLDQTLAGKAVRSNTVFKILFDDEALYFGIRCSQPVGVAPRARVTKRDGGLWTDDCVEVFLDPAGMGREYFHFIVNPLGVLYDSRCPAGIIRHTWDGHGVQSAAFVGDGFWSVELAIPFRNLVGPGDGKISLASWRFNVARECKTGPAEYPTFFATSHFFDTTKFGPLAGLDIDYARYLWELGPVSLRRVAPNEQVGAKAGFKADFTVAVSNRTGKFRPFTLTARANLPGGTTRKLTVAKTFAADSGQTVILPFSLPIREGGKTKLVFELEDRLAEKLAASRSFNVAVDTSPLKLTVTRPFYRSAIYATMNVRDVELELTLRWPMQLQKDDRLELMLRKAATTGPLASLTVTDTRGIISRHRLKIGKLKPGNYRCIARILRKNATVARAETTLHVFGPSPSEVRVNEYCNFVVNGKEFFPVGFFFTDWRKPAFAGCNVSFGYGLVKDLKTSTDIYERMARFAKDDRCEMYFPYPRRTWPHICGGHPGLALKPLPPDDAKAITERVRQYTDARGLLAWYLADEPVSSRFLPMYLKQVSDAVRAGDPYHPCYISFNNAGTIQAYNDACDAIGLHFYNGFTHRGPERPIADVAGKMQTARRLTGDKKAVIFSPQMFLFSTCDSPNVRPIRHDESRCIVFMSLVHGAKGIMWYEGSGINGGLEMRIGIPLLVDELRKLERVVLAHEKVEIPTANKDVHVLGKKLGEHLYVIAVNPHNRVVRTTLRLSDAWAKLTTMKELASETGKVKLTAGQLSLSFQPYQVRILTTDPAAPKLTTIEDIRGRFRTKREELLAAGNLCYAGRGTKVRVSEDFDTIGRAWTLVDGYTDYNRWGSLRKAAKGSWMEIAFGQPENVARVEVSSRAQRRTARRTYPGDVRDYTLELLIDGKWQPISGTASESRTDTVFTRSHCFPPRRATALRLTLTKNTRDIGCIHEIQAFSK